MNIDKSVFGVLSILVAVIVVATVAIPVIEDSSLNINTEKNNIAPRYSMIEDSNTSRIEVVFNGGSSYTIAGKTADYTGCYILTDKFQIRLAADSFTIYNPVYGYQTKFTTENNTVVFDQGVCKYKDASGNNVETPYDWIYYPDVGGEFGQYYLQYPIYVDKGTSVKVFSGPFGYAIYAAEVNDSGDVTWIQNPYTTTGAVTNQPIESYSYDLTITANVSSDAPAGCWAITSGTINVSTTDPSPSSSDTPPFFIAPVNYHEITSHDSTMISILQIVPLLLLIVPVMMAVRMYSSRGE